MTREQLIQAFHDSTDRPLDECARLLDEISPQELATILAEAKAQAIAHVEAIERGEFFQVELAKRLVE